MLLLGSKSMFHLQITGVCCNITSPVTGKSTDLPLNLEKMSVYHFLI